MHSVTLRPIIKRYATTLGVTTGQPLRRESSEATTTDGERGFERIEEPGTPWIVVYHPYTPQAETASAMFGTLKAARQAVERDISAWLPSVQRLAHAAGNHDERPSYYGCPICDEKRWAR